MRILIALILVAVFGSVDAFLPLESRYCSRRAIALGPRKEFARTLSLYNSSDDDDDSSEKLRPVDPVKQQAGFIFLAVLCAWHFVIGPALKEPLLAMRQ